METKLLKFGIRKRKINRRIQIKTPLIRPNQHRHQKKIRRQNRHPRSRISQSLRID